MGYKLVIDEIYSRDDGGCNITSEFGYFVDPNVYKILQEKYLFRYIDFINK